MRSQVPPAVVLVLACGAQLMVVLDGLIMSVALPEIRSGLHLTAAGQQWIVNGYLITFGGLLLLAARAADLLGHRQVFLVGTAVFTLASLGGSLAPNGATLITARLVQGVGAAALAPSSLSLLTAIYSGEQRARALSIWSATAGSAGALGLVLGGVITSGLGWRWVLLVNVPVGLCLWIAASTTLAPSLPNERRRMDVPGALTITVSVAMLTYAITRAEASGWASSGTLTTLVLAAAFLVLFAVIERHSPAPLVPLSILWHRNVLVANTIVAIIGAVMTATLVLLSLYQQRVLGDSPLRTGHPLRRAHHDRTNGGRLQRRPRRGRRPRRPHPTVRDSRLDITAADTDDASLNGTPRRVCCIRRRQPILTVNLLAKRSPGRYRGDSSTPLAGYEVVRPEDLPPRSAGSAGCTRAPVRQRESQVPPDHEHDHIRPEPEPRKPRCQGRGPRSRRGRAIIQSGSMTTPDLLRRMQQTLRQRQRRSSGTATQSAIRIRSTSPVVTPSRSAALPEFTAMVNCPTASP